MTSASIRPFALTWPCFKVRFYDIFCHISFSSLLPHKDTELKLHDIHYHGMSTTSGCKPSCDEWSYNAIQRSYSKESTYIGQIILNLLINSWVFIFPRYTGDYYIKLRYSLCLHPHTDFRDGCWWGVLYLWLQRNRWDSGRVTGTICRVLIPAMHVVLPEQSP